jgi:hypothetical protein
LPRVHLPCSSLAINGIQERHQARSLSLQRGESITRRCQNSAASTLWIIAATDVPAEGLLTLPPLTGVGAREILWEGRSGESFFIYYEGDLIADVLRDEEFARRLLGDLNRDFLRSLDDGKIIILSDSDEDNEVHEEKAVNIEVVPSSAARSLTPTASADDADGTDIGNTPDRVIGSSSSNGDEADLP